MVPSIDSDNALPPLNESTTFRKDLPKETNFVIIPFSPLSSSLHNIFKQLNFKVVYSSGHKIKDLLGNPKDKVGPTEKSGIYEISCSDCEKKYIGQTKRPILTRFKEHMAHKKYGRFEKSSVAQHIFDNDHRIDVSNLKLVKAVNNSKFLNIYESIEIFKNKRNIDVMNSDDGPIPFTPLFGLLKGRV